VKKEKLDDFLSTWIAISHATIYKANVEEDEVENMSRQIATMKNQVEYY
jgi:hypothetical protein